MPRKIMHTEATKCLMTSVAVRFFLILQVKEMVASQRKGQNNACISLLMQIRVLISLLSSQAQPLLVVQFLNRGLILSALPVYYQNKKQ